MEAPLVCSVWVRVWFSRNRNLGSTYLHSVPAFQFITLRLVEILVLFADLLDGGGELALEEGGRVDARVLEAQMLELLNLFRVHLFQEDELLFQTLLVVLKRQTLLDLALELVGDALNLVHHALSLQLVPLLLVLQVGQAATNQADFRLVRCDLVLKRGDLLLVTGQLILQLIVS